MFTHYKYTPCVNLVHTVQTGIIALLQVYLDQTMQTEANILQSLQIIYTGSVVVWFWFGQGSILVYTRFASWGR